MSTWLFVALWCLAGGSALWLLITLFKSGKPVRRCVVSALQGACALAAVNVTGMFTDVSLGLNIFTTVVSGVLGVPGVITLLLLNVIFGL